jgi:hypothetical protein
VGGNCRWSPAKTNRYIVSAREKIEKEKPKPDAKPKLKLKPKP